MHRPDVLQLLNKPTKDLALVDGRSFGPALVPEDEPGMIDAQGVEDRGVDVVDVEPVFDGMEADLVGLADDDSRLDAAAGHPHGEAVGVMVAAVAFLGHRRAAELAAPDDQRLVRAGRGA